MNQNPESFGKLAKLEWDAEMANRDDLLKSGFKVKKFKIPYWIKTKCGDILKN